MKKTIALFAMMLACGFAANAQETKATATVQEVTANRTAADDLKSLDKLIKLDENQKSGLLGLFEYKHSELANQNLSQERKDILAQAIETKMRATLTSDQNAKLDKNPKLVSLITR